MTIPGEARTMVRGYGDPLEVRTVVSDAGAGLCCDRPAVFRWHDRVYAVREVLGHWRERGTWLTTVAACTVHGRTSRPGAPDLVTGSTRTPRVVVTERDVWRVEAESTRTGGRGVYDLCREVSFDPPERPGGVLVADHSDPPDPTDPPPPGVPPDADPATAAGWLLLRVVG
jgi:hypothetical protein